MTLDAVALVGASCVLHAAWNLIAKRHLKDAIFFWWVLAAVVIITMNIIVDILYAVINPKIRYE